MPEFSPSPEQSEAEKEAQGLAIAHEIADLRSRANSDEDYEAILLKIRQLKSLFGVGIAETESGLSGEVSEQIEQAKEILGADFLGPEQIKTAFGTSVEIGEIPPIPFSRTELEQAKELGQFLILRLPLTMKQIRESFGGKLSTGEKMLYASDETTGELADDCWYKDETFYTEDTATAGWALVSKETISGSTNKNYLEQTDSIVVYLKNQVFGGETLPPKYQAAIDEFDARRDEITALIDSDWAKAAETLESLQITQLTRQSPAEAIYDLIVYFQNNDERLLPNTYTWTKRRASGGRLVCVGGFGAGGVRVDRSGPGGRYGDLGVSFSRQS